jgi:hypothetical protein
MNLNLTLLDLLLILGVSSLVTAIAFVHRPRVKALVFSFPIPFILANLALGEPVGASHAAGLLNLLLFLNLVRWLHSKARIPVVPTIAISAALYIGIGALLNQLIPSTPFAFWAGFATVLLVTATLLSTMEARVEPGHRTELPVALKFLAVSGVVTVVVLLKNVLGGFMTTFPLAGVVTVYETRRSLWTLSRQAPLLVLALATMMMVMRVCQQQAAMSVPLSLLPGLGAWLLIIVPFTIVRFRREDRMEREGNADRSGA